LSGRFLRGTAGAGLALCEGRAPPGRRPALSENTQRALATPRANDADENPAARWLARDLRAGTARRPWALALAPSLLWGGCLLAGNIQGQKIDWIGAYLAAVPLPALTLFALQGEWHFFRLTARLRAVEDLFASPMPLEEMMSGVAAAARRFAARGRLYLALGVLAPLPVAFGLGVGLGLDWLIAAVPATLSLGWVALFQYRLAYAPERRLETARSLGLTLPLLAARGPVSALFLTILSAAQHFFVFAPFALLPSMLIAPWRTTLLAWRVLGLAFALWALLMVWCSWLSSRAAADRDDAFGAALRRHLNRQMGDRERRGKT
jgi:hypothetical protein